MRVISEFLYTLCTLKKRTMEDRPVTDTVKAVCIGEEIEMVPMVSPDVTVSMELLVKEDKTEDPISLGENSQGKGYLRKRMNLLDSIAFVVGGTIGSGIYIRPAFILEKTGSFGVSMICWLAGMLIAVFGGLCYIELALLIPKTGQEYVYILEGYSFKKRNKWTELLGSLLAFLYAWTSIIIIRPTSIAIITLTCSRYLIRPIYIDCDIPEGVVKCLAISILISQGIIVSRSVKLMAKIGTFITFIKVLSIVFVVLVGVAGVIKRGDLSDDIRHPFQGSSFTSVSDIGGLALALYSVLWAYDGWNTFGFAVEEMKQPERNLPRAMMIGLFIICLCYVLVNFSFFSVLSYEEIVSTQTVALPFGRAVMGKAGLVVFPLLVAISTYGTSILNVYIASRSTFSSAREHQFPEVFCGVHKKWGTPIASVTLQVVITSIYIVSGDISTLIESFSASLWVFIFLSFLSILIMRFTHKDDRRPFKVIWIIPVLMVVVSVFVILLPLTTSLWPSLSAFAIILSGAPVYIIFVMKKPWRLRPDFLNRCNDFVTKHVNRLLQADSAR